MATPGNPARTVFTLGLIPSNDRPSQELKVPFFERPFGGRVDTFLEMAKLQIGLKPGLCFQDPSGRVSHMRAISGVYGNI
jgi:hypothetical protein